MTKRCSLVSTLLMTGAAWLLLEAFAASPAMAAKGTVMWVNPPENHGKIKRDDDMDDNDYNYSINAGDTNPPGTKFNVGDRVTFTPRGRRATNVTLVEDPGIPDDPAGGDPAKRSAIRPASAALGLLAVGGLYGAGRRRSECV